VSGARSTPTTPRGGEEEETSQHSHHTPASPAYVNASAAAAVAAALTDGDGDDGTGQGRQATARRHTSIFGTPKSSRGGPAGPSSLQVPFSSSYCFPPFPASSSTPTAPYHF